MKADVRNTITKYLDYWVNQNYQGMLSKSQQHWKLHNTHEDQKRFFHNFYNAIQLKDFKLVKTLPCVYNGGKLDQEVIIDVVVLCELVRNKKTKKQKRIFRLIKEDSKGNPDKKGNWGVNPKSAERIL